MNLYQQKRRRKLLLLLFAIIFGMASIFYSNSFVQKMEREERMQFQLWVKATERYLELQDDASIASIVDMVRNNSKVPLIITNAQGEIITYQNLDPNKRPDNTDPNAKAQYDPAYFKKQLALMRRQHPPVTMQGYDGSAWQAYYRDSLILTQLRYFPYIQLAVIAAFLITSYVLFSSSRRLEQDQVWVGLAKETAHQLGTPISSLLAWLEILKGRARPQDEQMILHVENDIQRLEVVADRFSKIGSRPVLEDHNVYTVVQNFVNYFRVRTSDKIQFVLKGDTQVRAMLNIPLFDWVIENLLKNAVTAIGQEGTITVNIIENLAKEQVFIDVHDTGKGIARSKFDTVFQPGYTTRQRGWGLGLSLTRRMVENYHRGQVFVKESEVGKGTTFRIVLNSSLKYIPA